MHNQTYRSHFKARRSVSNHEERGQRPWIKKIGITTIESIKQETKPTDHTSGDSCPRMERAVCLDKVRAMDMGVDFGGFERSVTKEHLYSAQVGTTFEHMRGEGMP